MAAPSQLTGNATRYQVTSVLGRSQEEDDMNELIQDMEDSMADAQRQAQLRDRFPPFARVQALPDRGQVIGIQGARFHGRVLQEVLPANRSQILAIY